MNAHHLKAQETLFIDDTSENTITAASLGIQVWNLIPGKEDVTELFTKTNFIF
jgi:putative hydrolase of the HAD superfamily